MNPLFFIEKFITKRQPWQNKKAWALNRDRQGERRRVNCTGKNFIEDKDQSYQNVLVKNVWNWYITHLINKKEDTVKKI